MKRLIVLLILILIGHTAALGDSTWKGDLGLGIVTTQGNSDSQTFDGKFNISQETETWRNSLSASALFTETDGESTAERYTVSAKTNYKFTPRDYVFLNVDYDRDLFTQFDYQFTESVGYGRIWIKTETINLDSEIGAGGRQSKIKDEDDFEREVIYRLASNFRWDFTKTATFQEQFSADFGEEFNIYKSTTSLAAQIDNSWTLKFAFDVKHVTEVPDDIENTDTQTSATVVYKF